MKTETGVMVIKDGNAWGIAYNDGRSTSYWWVNIEDGEIKDPKYYKKPEDFTYKGSDYIDELSKGKVLLVERTTKVTIKNEH